MIENLLALPESTALILIDLQRAIDHPSWGERNNCAAEQNVQALLAHWRSRGMAVYHVRHDSSEPGSTYRPAQPGHEFKSETAPLPGEPIIAKCVHSAFIGSSLESELRRNGNLTVAIAGVITNNSVEATVRMAADLGFHVYLVEDGCFTFGRCDWRGVWRTADEVHAMSLANLHGEYCTVVTTEVLLESMPGLSR